MPLSYPRKITAIDGTTDVSTKWDRSIAANLLKDWADLKQDAHALIFAVLHTFQGRLDFYLPASQMHTGVSN